MPPASRELPERSVAARIADRLRRESGVPIYRQLVDAVRELIVTGDLAAGAPIPPQRELAAALGVSEMTVRRALQEIAAEGHIDAQAGRGTSVAARDVASRRADRPLSLGIAFADLAEGYPFLAPMLAGIRATPREVAVRLFDVPRRGDVAGAMPDLAGFDGVLMMSPVNVALLGHCQQRRVPCVLLYSDVADGYSRCVVVDYGPGIREAVGHLVSRGRRDIALMTAGVERFSTGQTIDAFRSALEVYGLPFEQRRVHHVGYQERDGFEAMARLLDSRDRPAAVICASDHLARGVLLAAHSAGIRVPDDLAVIGAGRLLDGAGWPVPLTSIDLGLAEVGEAARRLVEQAAENAVSYRTTIRSRLVIGETS